MSENEIITSEESFTPDPNQLDMFDMASNKDADLSGILTLSDFSSWVDDNFGGIGIQGAFQISALLLCCDVIAQDISKSTLRMRELLPNGTSKIVLPSPRKANKPGLPEFLALDANDFLTWQNVIEMMVYWSCLTDNAYAGIIRATDGTPVKIVPFQSNRVVMKVNGNEVFYDCTAGNQFDQAMLGSGFRTFAYRDMLHIRTRVLDGMKGYGTLSAGKSTIDGIKAIMKYSTNIFSEDGQMRGIFTTEKEGEIPEASFQRLRSQMKILMNKFRQLTEPIVLENGLKFQSTSANPKDIELTNQFDQALAEICRLFRMPPHKIFLMDGSKYDNLETQEKMYVGDTLIPRAKPFEQEFARKLLTPAERLGNFLEFDRTEMTLRDTKIETDRAIRGLERGALEIDEVRAVFGYNPLPNGAGRMRIVPVNMVVVDENNKVIIGASSTADTPSDDQTEETAPASETSTATKSAGLRLVEG